MNVQRGVIVAVVALLVLAPMFALAQMQPGRETGPGMRGGMASDSAG